MCMANVLISSAQKISASARPAYAQAVIPQIMNFIQVVISSHKTFFSVCVYFISESLHGSKGFVNSVFLEFF